MSGENVSTAQNATRLELYAILKAHYEKMLEVAQANDWDLLTDLQQQAQGLLTEAGQALPTQDEDTASIAAMITVILELDAKINEHTLPCLESTRKLLRGVVQDKNVRKTYGAF